MEVTMGFDKRYPNRKDWRRQYRPNRRGSVRSCRPHGGCPWCLGNRRHQFNKQLLRAGDYDRTSPVARRAQDDDRDEQ
jgi:hypothetical protein